MEICWQRIRGELRGACLLSLALLLTSAAAADRSPETPFVRASGTAFILDGKPFFVTGVNNHYLTFASQNEVTRVLDIDEEVEIRQWTVETRQGRRSFQTHLDDWPRHLPNGGLLIRDVAGDLYRLATPSKMDAKSRELLWAFVD